MGIPTKKLLKCRDTAPLCVACQFGDVHIRPWHHKHKGRKAGSIHQVDQTEPADGVSVDQLVSAQPGLVP